MYFVKLLSFAFILVFASLRIAAEDCENYDENGSCTEDCPQDMVKYSPPCDEPTMSQKTCRQPTARSIGGICDYIRCDCPEPKVWDEAAEVCVKIEDCSNQSKVTDKVNEQN